MSTEYRNDDILAMLPAYALGTLDADEMLAVEDYLRTSGTPELEARLAELEDSIALLAFSAPEVSLPTTVKSKVLTAIQAEVTPTIALATTPAPVRQSPTSPKIQSEPAAPGWLTLLGNMVRPAAWAAVGALVVFFLLQPGSQGSRAELTAAQARITQLETDLQNTQTQLTALQADNTTLQQVNQELQTQLQNSDLQLAVLARPSQTFTLAGTESAPNATGTVFVSNRQSVLVLSGLDLLPDDSTYELWLIPAEGSPRKAGLIALTQSDTNSLSITLPDDASNYAFMGISVEPAGGSPDPNAPSGPVVLLGGAS